MKRSGIAEMETGAEVDGDTVSPFRVLNDDKDDFEEKRYEIEGMAIWEGRKYVAVERRLLETDPASAYEDDGIFWLSASK